MSFPLIFKEGANSGGPPDLRGRRQNPRPKRARMKSRANSLARPPSQKENPPQTAFCPQATRDEASLSPQNPAALAGGLFVWNALPHELTATSLKPVRNSELRHA